MRLAALVVLVEVALFQFISRAVRFLVAQDVFLGDFSDAQAFDAGRRVAEIFVDQVLFDADGFKNLCAVVAVDCRNAHLGHDGQDAFDGGVDVVLFGRFVIDFLELLVGNEFLDGFQGDVRVDGRNAVADEGTEMMDFARFARFQDEADVGADALVDEIMVQGCRGQEAGMAAMRELTPRSDRTRMLAPFLMAFKASMQSDSMAVSMPSEPLLTG